MNPASPISPPVPPAQAEPAARPSRPTRKKGRRGWWLLAAVPVLLVPIFGWGLAGRLSRDKPVTHTVRREKLQRAITARGDLEAVETSEIVCRVRSRAHGRTTSTTIKSIVSDGSRVERGQLLVEFDDSGLQDELEALQGPLTLAQANLVLAEKNLDILRSQNDTDIKTAEVALELAKIDLEKYVKGDYEQVRKEVQGRLTQAETDVKMWLDRSSWTNRMTRRGFSTRSQNEADQSRLQSATLAQQRVREELRVLDDYTFLRNKKELDNKVAEAKRALDRLSLQARAKEAQAEADRLAKQRTQALYLERGRDLEEQIVKCRILAPHDGMVIYYQSKQSKSGSGSQQSVIAQGEPVYEGQKLMTIPDLSRQMVRVRLQEAVIARVHPEEHEPSGFSETLQAAQCLAPGCASLPTLGAWFELRPLFHDRDQRLAYGGQEARIYIDALQKRTFQGHVKSVANVPSQFDSKSSELRCYDTLVAIDESIVDPRPDLSAEVTILDDDEHAPVLAVPIRSVVHPPGAGSAGTCYVLTSDGPEVREVQLGTSDDQLVEVRDGLDEGDEIVLDPNSVRMKH